MKHIAKMIRKKQSRYLKISLISFTVSLMFLGAFSVFMVNQYMQVNHDFIENKNLRFIEVSGKSHQDHLKFKDEKKVCELLKGMSVRQASEYVFNNGINGEDDQDYYVHMLTDSSLLLKSKKNTKENTVYGLHTSKSKMTFDAPVVKHVNGGYLVDKVKPMTLHVSHEPLGKFFTQYNDTVYVDEKTFAKMIKISSNMNFKQYKKAFDEGADFGSQTLDRILIYVNDVKDLRTVAKKLDKGNYQTNYVLNAFDNFDQSMKMTIIIVFALIVLILLVTSLNMILSFKNYISIQKKDMGILKYYEYSSSEISSLYAYNSRYCFYYVSAIALSITWMISFVILKHAQIAYGMITGTVVIIVPVLVLYLIARLIIHNVAHTQFLSLISNKEFE